MISGWWSVKAICYQTITRRFPWKTVSRPGRYGSIRGCPGVVGLDECGGLGSENRGGWREHEGGQGRARVRRLGLGKVEGEGLGLSLRLGLGRTGR